MTREMIEGITSDQLQDYLTCPNLYYFKHVVPVPVPLPAHQWMNHTIHRAILQTLKAHEATDYCLRSFEHLFTQGRDKDGDDVDIDFRDDSPEKLMVKGRGIIQLYTSCPWFGELSPVECSLPGSFDSVLPDCTIVDIRLSSRVVLEEDYRAHPRFCFQALALSKILKLDYQSPTKIRCDLLIKTNIPKLQFLMFTVTPSDKNRLIEQAKRVMQAIKLELFYPTPGILCAKHCLYKFYCQKQYTGGN